MERVGGVCLSVVVYMCVCVCVHVWACGTVEPIWSLYIMELLGMLNADLELVFFFGQSSTPNNENEQN